MTKQELYTAALGRFDKVQPVADWQRFENPTANKFALVRYDIQVYRQPGGFATHTIYVENDGEANEQVQFPSGDFTAVTEPPLTFAQELEAYLQSQVESKTLAAYIPDKMGKNAATVYVYLDGTSVTERRALVIKTGQGLLHKLIA